MNCRDAKFWIFSCRPNASWPAEVVTHLQQCTECQSLQAQLKQMDQQLDKIGSAPSKIDLKGQILARVEKTPQTSVAKDTMPVPRWQWHRVAFYLAGSAALILFGWFVGRNDEVADPGKTVEVFRDKIVSVHSSADRNLFTLLLKRNARLVQTSEAKDRLETLLDMADDCRQHAFTLIEQGPRDTLPLAIDLYLQLLREGILVQLAQAPAENRLTLQATARTRLAKMAEPPAMTTRGLPRIVEDQRDMVQNATRETMELVNQPEKAPTSAPPRKNARPESMPPAATLVLYAVTFSSESDPLVKADSCSDCIQRLVPYMMLYLAEDTAPKRAEMGQQFGEMINHGVYEPLALATAKDPPKQVKEKADRISETTSKAIADMEKNLQNAPPAAKPGLQRALEASKKGWEKSKGKGKGPPWMRDNPDQKFPPGKGKASNSPKDQSKAVWQQRQPVDCVVLSARLSKHRFRLPASDHAKM